MNVYKLKFFVILFINLVLIFNFRITVLAVDPTVQIVVETLSDNATVSSSFDVNGKINGKIDLKKVEVSVDNKLLGEAKYIADSGRFSYTLNTKKLVNGAHKLNIILYDVSGTSYNKEIPFLSKNIFTPIVGQTKATKGQMMKYLLDNNPYKSYGYADNFVLTLLDEAAAENIRADVAFAQMMKETNFLKFTGKVQEDQNNFAGLGATGGEVVGASFPDIRTGIRAVIQHLKAYATVNVSLNRELVDTRFKYVSRGTAEYVEWLGIQDNPFGKGWASDNNYGYDIINRINNILSLKIINGKAKINSFSVAHGDNIITKADAISTNKVLYRFWICDRTTGEWEIVQDFSENNVLKWTPTKAGRYTIVVHAKDSLSNGTGDYHEDYSSKDVVVEPPKAKATALNISSELWDDESSVITAMGTSENKVMYRFWIGDRTTGEWKIIQDYSENNSFRWTPTKAGRYAVVVYVKDASNRDMSESAHDSYLSKEVEVKRSKAAITSLILDSKAVVNGEKIITVNGTSKNKVVYRFWICDRTTGEWEIVQDFSENNVLKWTPTKAGRYTIVVHAKDSLSNGTGDYHEDYSSKDVVVEPPKATATELNINSELWTDESSVITALGTSKNKVMYRFWIGDRTTGEWKIIQDYSENNSFIWTPTKAGRYAVVVHVKDSSNRDMSENVHDSYLSKEVEVKSSKAVITRLVLDSKAVVNREKIITVNGTSKNKVLYRFWVCDRTTGEWEIVQDFSENNILKWTPTRAGIYTIVVHAKDSLSNGIGDYHEDYSSKDVIVMGTIVLDAGHGGSDPGATGNGYKEATLNMQVVQKLGAKLQSLGFNVLYSRPSGKDVFVSLQDRAKFANDNKADLFISIHHDANDSSSANGTSTHYSTYRPSIDANGVYVTYNGKKYPFIKELDGKIYYMDGSTVKTVSINNATPYDTTPSEAGKKSAVLAEELVDALSSLGVSNRDSRDHNLYVTRWTAMPSVLIEMGFISNKTEITKIANPTYQDKAAQKMADVIYKFFNNN